MMGRRTLILTRGGVGRRGGGVGQILLEERNTNSPIQRPEKAFFEEKEGKVSAKLGGGKRLSSPGLRQKGLLIGGEEAKEGG